MSANVADVRYPPIADYALISNCQCAALVSRAGSIDWCCIPRLDADSCFGRLLGWDRGGYCLICPDEEGCTITRRYLPGTMIVETTFRSATAEARLYDCFIREPDGDSQALCRLARIVEGVAGDMPFRIEVQPRFDYGEIIPRVQQQTEGIFTAIGGNKGLVIQSDAGLEVVTHRDLAARFRISPGGRKRLTIRFAAPELIGQASRAGHGLDEVDAAFERTRQWWRDWTARIGHLELIDPQTLRSIIALKSLMFDPTGAIAAAATTSLPESPGGTRNWDYRFSWVRDSVFTIRALSEFGYEDEALRFLQFIQRCSAGSAEQLQIMYAVDGKRRLTEIELDWLEGYRRSQPVRIGNSAYRQHQLDVYGEIMEIAWIWHGKGHRIDWHYWDFLADVVNRVVELWDRPDHGIWEIRGAPLHHVHSKVWCWAALDRGIRLAQAYGLAAPLPEWMQAREQIQKAIETRGYDAQRGIFTQAFDSNYLDAALLLMPRSGFVAYDDPRMVRTVDAICAELDRNGMLLRYMSPDGLPGREGVFIPCTFWLVTCLARQGRREKALKYYRTAMACANDLGLFSEEYDVGNRQMLGNFPQGLTHVSQIVAKLALDARHGK